MLEIEALKRPERWESPHNMQLEALDMRNPLRKV